MRALVYHGPGADAVIEPVGAPATFELAGKLVRPGGRIANIGVHGQPAILHREHEWIRDITITTGLVDADQFITHRFSSRSY
jgi:alcohol dehydrogenase